MLDQKLEYLPAGRRAFTGFVESPEMWLYSSARDYYGTGKGELELLFID